MMSLIIEYRRAKSCSMVFRKYAFKFLKVGKKLFPHVVDAERVAKMFKSFYWKENMIYLLLDYLFLLAHLFFPPLKVMPLGALALIAPDKNSKKISTNKLTSNHGSIKQH